MTVAFVNTNTMLNSASSPTSNAFTVTNSGANLAAFCIISYDGASTPAGASGVTLGGQAMALAGTHATQATEHQGVEVWVLANPPTGTPTLAITMSGAFSTIYYNVVVYNGVNAITPVRSGTYQALSDQTASGGAISIVVTSNANDRTLTAINGGSSTAVGTYTSTQEATPDGRNATGSTGGAHDHSATAAASQTHTWTLGAATQVCCLVGFSINGDPSGPSALTLYANNPIQGGSNAGLLTLAAPAASTSTTGWTVGTTAATQYSRGTYNTEVPSGNFTATAQPSGAPVNLGEDCYRISAQTSGVFSAGTWYSTVSVIAVTSGGIQDGRARFRYWRSLSADGTSATEITQGIMVGSRITELSTTVAQSSSASTQVSTQTFNNEYLFLQLGWETL